MSFRRGNQGESLWKDCLREGVAIITYRPLHNTDLSKFPKFEPKNLWDKLAPTQRFSLAAVAYEMNPGDVIYAKEGSSIVAKGLIRRGYRFNQGILKRKDVNWGHFVEVDWTEVVPEDQIRYVGPTQSTVHLLTAEQVSNLERAFSETRKKQPQPELKVLEGRLVSCQRQTKLRDRRIIEIKKQLSDYRCELYRLMFEEMYGEIGHHYIVVHHLKPIGVRKRASRTSMNDLILVCQNCHAMLHRMDPPLTPNEMRKLLAR